MSENLMGGGFAAPGPELPEETPARGRDPKVLIGGGIGLAVVALAGGYLLLGGGGGGSTATPPLATTIRHTATATPSASAAVTAKATAVIRTFHGEVGRDPFKALITPPPPAPTTSAPKTTSTTLPAVATTSPGSVVGLPTTGVSGLPTTLPTGVVPVVPTTTAAPTTTPPAVMVVLKAIAFHGTTPYVVVSYAGKSLMLTTGDTSNGNLKVVAIAPDDGTATFQLGDQTFDLHIGQSYVD
ncbi:hypothetical protein acdb102_43560 [Acidothermaceae bacterium B102]|nr:hypothetical protein acdb102_43560 [Acidothermaceae bacterium B102]